MWKQSYNFWGSIITFYSLTIFNFSSKTSVLDFVIFFNSIVVFSLYTLFSFQFMLLIYIFPNSVTKYQRILKKKLSTVPILYSTFLLFCFYKKNNSSTNLLKGRNLKFSPKNTSSKISITDCSTNFHNFLIIHCCQSISNISIS